MVIRMTLKTDSAAIEGVIGFIEDYADFAYGVFEGVVDESRPNMLDELQTQPPKSQGKVEWTSDKQRKFVMRKLRLENNIPYRRTGKLAKAWIVETVRDGNTYAMVIENPSKVAKFVYGSLAQNVSAASRFQQKFHANTGWELMTNTVRFWLDAIQDEYATQLESEAPIEFKRRAFTFGSKRR